MATENFIEDINTGSVRATSSGREAYSSQFAKAGINISSVNTKEKLVHATDKSLPFFYRDIIGDVSKVAASNPHLKSEFDELILSMKAVAQKE